MCWWQYRTLACLLLLNLLACGDPPAEQSEALKREIAMREPRQISEQELMAHSLKMGEAWLDSLSAADSNWCQKIEPGLPFWKEDSKPLRNSRIDSVAAEILLAYELAATEGMPLGNNVQRLADTAFLYTRALAGQEYPCLEFDSANIVQASAVFTKRTVAKSYLSDSTTWAD